MLIHLKYLRYFKEFKSNILTAFQIIPVLETLHQKVFLVTCGSFSVLGEVERKIFNF